MLKVTNTRWDKLALGLLTFVPGMPRVLSRGTGGTDSARYCYSVWLRHLVMAHGSGLNTMPRVIAELGPGDSLGIGLAALISGSERYFALDAKAHAAAPGNLEIFDQLVELFRSRSPLPDEEEFPQVRPLLAEYGFPAQVLDEGRLARVLEPRRIAQIRRSLLDNGDGMIAYKAPWDDVPLMEAGSVDMIFSQAVLEHVEDLEATYHAMREWLKPDGFISHQIDYKCHNTAREWNGHWMYSDFTWRLMKGRWPYLLNRAPHSEHRRLIDEAGFEIVCEQLAPLPTRLRPDDLAPRFRRMSRADLTTSAAFVQANRRS